MVHGDYRLDNLVFDEHMAVRSRKWGSMLAQQQQKQLQRLLSTSMLAGFHREQKGALH